MSAGKEERMAEVCVFIIGAGPSGLSAAIKLRERGINDLMIVDRATQVGGTWAMNDYPGLCCDVPSEMYSLGYALKPDWSRTFAPQAEIRDYLESVAKQFALMPFIELGQEVEGAHWNAVKRCWDITTDQQRVRAQYLIAAPGFIGEPVMPQFPGQDQFQGTLMHSARWNHQHDFSGERVAVVGSGASAIQFLPKIQPKVRQLISFQRTPSWVLPKPDFPMPAAVSRLFSRIPASQRLVRQSALLATEANLPVFMNEPLLRLISHPLGKFNIYRGVKKSALRKRLTPQFTLGCKRPLLSNDWYPALAKDNVEVVFKGVSCFTQSGVVDEDGTEYPVDTVVFGTGYAVDDPKIFRLIKGRHGLSISDYWAGNPRSTYGVAIPTFPNFFLMLGPNSHSVQGSVMVTSEWQAIYIAQAIDASLAEDKATLEINPRIHNAFNRRIERRLRKLPIRPDVCQSYYLDRHGRNRFVWPESGLTIKRTLTRFNRADYLA